MRDVWAQVVVIGMLIGGALGAFLLKQEAAGYSLFGAAVACAPGLFAKGPLAVVPPEARRAPPEPPPEIRPGV